MSEKIRELLLTERDGCHGESERRAVAEFVLEALECSGPDDPTAEDLAFSLCEAAGNLATRLAVLRHQEEGARQ